MHDLKINKKEGSYNCHECGKCYHLCTIKDTITLDLESAFNGICDFKERGKQKHNFSVACITIQPFVILYRNVSQRNHLEVWQNYNIDQVGYKKHSNIEGKNQNFYDQTLSLFRFPCKTSCLV